jgi:sugar (pentulose or hexulose) kinase
MVLHMPEFLLKAVNFSAHGAAFVHIDAHGKPVTPLYDYLKPFPEALKAEFYDKYGGEEAFSLRTASPVLGHLNVGMQLYRLKYERLELFSKIKTSLFLPQYLSYLMTQRVATDITSIGCHTNLWDFTTQQYHSWVIEEHILEKLAPIKSPKACVSLIDAGQTFLCGIGLHDSSAAMIPYLKTTKEPFALLSTGTWNITMNPFNDSPLTVNELKQDCLCYIRYDGKPVKASRLLTGQKHMNDVAAIAEHFHVDETFLQRMTFQPKWLNHVSKPWVDCTSADEAYHHCMQDIVERQKISSSLVLDKSSVRNIYVDGGFSKNDLFMKMLAKEFPAHHIQASTITHAAAWGAALVHEEWGGKQFD